VSMVERAWRMIAKCLRLLQSPAQKFVMDSVLFGTFKERRSLL
jgi:hypothetical protein